MTQDKKDEIIKNQDIKKEHVVSLQPITNEGYRKYTANYSYSNSNFVIQNLNGKYQNNIFQPTICVLKNILQRGNPTLMSKFLQDKIGTIHKREDYNQSYPLIDKNVPEWKWTIKGFDEKNYYPAKDFFYKYLPEDFSDCLFIQNLLLPEALIQDIVPDKSYYSKNFVDQRVDFYLPQVNLVIEIDGKQHNEELQKAKDEERDNYLLKHRIETIRISTDELNKKNLLYKNKVKNIKSKIANLFYNQKKNNPTEIKINEYKDHYINGTDLSNPNYLVTAIMRFQILILELLSTGLLSFEKPWNLEINCRDVQGFVDLAIDDLFNWFNHLYKLRNIYIDKPTINIKYVIDNSEFSTNDSIKIDFSLLKRYTDENILNPNIIYVRTDYFDNCDYFKISTSDLINYPENIIKQKDSLLYVAWCLFLQSYDNLKFETTEFREGQLEIIANALNRRHTIGLLPTGSGKSICYQMACILQPAISFVVCPIKSLMVDQAVDLENAKITRVQALTSDNSSEEKNYIQQEFKNGKYFFIFISPERFQIQKFREYLSEINRTFNIAYAVIDEAHCLSEWGHDFRTSYLNLVNAINRLCSNFCFIALTATASENVLKDLKIELQIEKNEDVKTQKKYSREELAFNVQNVDSNDKVNFLEKMISDYSNSDFFSDKCGVVFTPTVNGKKGCFKLSQRLTMDLNKKIDFYSGLKPDYLNMDEQTFTEYKKTVQSKFKDSASEVLVATKAFGMGVNKGNIGFTIHFGIPASMESFYQEAGRAGRAKNLFKTHKAMCHILLSKESLSDNELNKLWANNLTLNDIKTLQKNLKEDLSTQLYFLTFSENDIETELASLNKFYDYIKAQNNKTILIKNTWEFCNNNIEKSIFKLMQLGIIEDWTVVFRGNNNQYNLEIGNLEIENVKNCVEKTVKKYDSEFSFNNLNDENNVNYSNLVHLYTVVPESFEKYARILLQWHFDKFFYSRRQSLKKVYETCVKVADGKMSEEEFKIDIENYFRNSNKTHMLQTIADNPLNTIEQWFEVLLVFEDSAVTDKPIKEKEAKGLLSSLSRFLESYQQNTGLDFISGLLRLIVNDFNNNDGRKRFENSLRQIKQYYDETTRYTIFKKLFQTVKLMHFSKDKRTELAKSIANVFDNKKEILYDLYNNLEDDYSLKEICVDYLTRINEIKSKIEVNNE